MRYLSKSDFTVARSCATKLYYKKKGYPTSLESDDFKDYLAEGGYLVGKLATLLYPDGIPIETGRDHQKAIDLTNEYLQRENVTLFEPSIAVGGMLVRVDILEKKGNVINLIEVKSKSWSSEYTGKSKLSKLREKLEDVTYQYIALKERFPNHEINPFLLLPDKAKTTQIEGLNTMFKVTKGNDDPDSKFKYFNIEVDESRLEELRADDLMTLFDVSDEVKRMEPEISRVSGIFIKSLTGDLEKLSTPLRKACFKCEYKVTDDKHLICGYDECWEGMPVPEHHIKDVYYGGGLGANKLYDEIMIPEKKLSMFDIPESEIKGKRGLRQRIQLDNTRAGKEWFSETMAMELKSWQYPLHFIDFETSMSALPFHKGMRPYEQVAFQWSCHTIRSHGAEPEHTEWISMEPAFPNFTFAKKLMDQIGLAGTFLMWSPYENTIMKAIYYQLEDYGHDDPALKAWMERLVKLNGAGGMFTDQCQFARDHYFHPMMKGSVSIKDTLPAVLKENKCERNRGWLQNFGGGLSLYEELADGGLKNPYKLLPAITEGAETASVSGGGDAMRAYGDMLYGIHKGNDDLRESYKKGLLNYCKLDTLAMVMIWEHWNELIS
jgi:hypothetical protein